MTRPVDLTHGPWQFVDVAGEPLDHVPERSRPSLTFEPDGQVYGSGGVNRLRGTYLLDGDHLTFGPVVSTRMAGTPEHTRREEAVLALLSGEVRVRVANEPGSTVLVLTDARGQGSRLVAVAHEPTRPEPPSEPEPGT